MTDFPKVPEGILGEETTEKTNTELFLSLVGQYFPEAIKDGEVDFTVLKEEMGEFPQVSGEHYDFTWAGKQAAKKEAMSDIYGRTLKYKPQDSLNPDTTENIYIEGDNLEALKLLRRNYHGKIKMIYIDPPYNTGNDFVYRDNFTMSEDELAELSGNTVNGERLQKNTNDKSKYHTNWLNMMYPRLKIARDLLTDDGVIFISIDDNEQENLKKVCDEIFGASNYVCPIIWQSKSGGAHDERYIVKEAEYILVYSKNKPLLSVGRRTVTDEKYNLEDEYILTRGKYILNKLDRRMTSNHYTESLNYPIIAPDGTEIWPGGDSQRSNLGWNWRWGKEKVSWGIKEGFIEFKCNNGKWSIYSKQYERVDNNNNSIERTLPYRNIYLSAGFSNTQASGDMIKFFDFKIFEYAKPYKLIKEFLDIANLNKNDIVLDFFSGSATTAHAVMQLNAEDGGHRKFIMVQLPEETEEKSEAYKAGYKNICEIGKERIRRAAKKIHEDNPDAQFDDGFKVFEVADTNIKWNTVNDEEIQSLSEIDYGNDKERIDFTKGYIDIDVVYEIMLRQFDIPLSTPIEKLPEVSDRTYIFADAVVVCLEPDITTELIEKLAAIEPTPAKFVLRDSAFNDDIELKDVSFRRLSALIANHQTEEERKSKYNNYTVEFI